MKPLLEIMKLNQSRYGMDFDYKAAIVKLSEELGEFTEAATVNDTDEMLDALCDITVIAIGEMAKLGYNPELLMKQVIKHISSRKQDPEQEARWSINNKQPGEKWLKDVNQDPATLYTTNFGTCKLSQSHK